MVPAGDKAKRLWSVNHTANNSSFLTSLHKYSLDILVYVNLGPDVSEMFIPNSKRLLSNVLLDTPNWRATVFQFWKTSNSLSISSLDITYLGLPIATSSWTGCCVPWISRIRLSTYRLLNWASRKRLPHNL